MLGVVNRSRPSTEPSQMFNHAMSSERSILPLSIVGHEQLFH